MMQVEVKKYAEASAADDELKVVEGNTSRVDPPAIDSCTDSAEILKFQWLVRQVPMSETVARKAVDLVRATRPSDASAPDVVKQYARYGASIRATQFLALASLNWRPVTGYSSGMTE